MVRIHCGTFPLTMEPSKIGAIADSLAEAEAEAELRVAEETMLDAVVEMIKGTESDESEMVELVSEYHVEEGVDVIIEELLKY